MPCERGMRLTQAAESGEKEGRETGARAAATPSRSCRAAMNARMRTHTTLCLTTRSRERDDDQLATKVKT